MSKQVAESEQTQIRPEYPRPNFVRNAWKNLNGEWEFCFDLNNSGVAKNFFLQPFFDKRIIVPFCPESKLSGIGCIDFMPSVWYAKNFTITPEQLDGRVLFHIGACDYKTTVYVNGIEVGVHVGGYTPITFDISHELKIGENRVVVHAEDDTRSDKQPTGKQSKGYISRGCYYTRTTGIWQTVWLEYVPKLYLQSVKINATDLNGEVALKIKLNDFPTDAKVAIEVFYEGEKITEKTCLLCGKETCIGLSIPSPRLWSVGAPNLYDIKYTLFAKGEKVDEVEGYFGIRRIDICEKKILLNGKPVFQRLILDQGFYPDGIYTASSEEELKRDIEYSMKLGFNGARMHEKVFEERYLYHADKMGYLLWGEYADWGIDTTSPDTLHTLLPQWIERVERDYNHPSIICWCPYNETAVITQADLRRAMPANVSSLYFVTKAIDGTRPVVDTSGYIHTETTDIFDVHDYNQDTEKHEERYKKLAEGEYFANFELIPGEKDKPYIVSEFGGMRWSKEMDKSAWGYGAPPKTFEEVADRYEKLSSTLLKCPIVTGYCYTQLFDVEQEQNGLFYYDRSKKFPDEIYQRIRLANERKASIEEE